MQDGDNVATPHFVRITSGGKIKLWVDFSLKFLRDNPGKPLTLHTLSTNPIATGFPGAIACISAAESSTEHALGSYSASARIIPRLISVVEIIKREFFKAIAPGPQSIGLYQYNHLGFLEEHVVNPGSESMDEGPRQRGISTALKGHNFLNQEKTPYMKITLCTNALPALEVQTTCQYPSVKKASRSARARQRRRLLKDSGKQA